MSAVRSLETIRDLIKQAMAEPDPRDAKGLLIQAQTHAMIQISTMRRADARAEYVEHIEHGGAVQ